MVELAKETTGPLKGVRVLDMTSVVFGAYATQMLGDLGADVIKVEFPGGRRGGGGDIMRWAGHPPEGGPDDLGPIYMAINRNKRSMLLDLREEKSAAALRKLIKSSGVKSWDEAVLRAIDKTEVLPRDVDGRVVPEFLIAFRPRD